jgi:2-hydroxy-3-keto-5-methylthiopentenyl-1-phosphate phosphatase
MDMLVETENHPDPEYHQMHWRDHINKIKELCEKILETNDPEFIAKYTSDIMMHADSAHEKHHTKYDRQGVDKGSPMANIHTNNEPDF